jgi:hypothetical protein
VEVLIFDDKPEPYVNAKAESAPTPSIALEYLPHNDLGRVYDFSTGWSITFELQPTGN